MGVDHDLADPSGRHALGDVGVASRRQSESASCEATRQGGGSDGDVESGTFFYNDECLHGIENAAKPPADADTKACVAAINATAACASSKVATIDACKGAPL